MELILHEKPNLLIEAVKLIDAANEHIIGEEVKFINKPYKVGMNEEQIKERYSIYINHRQILLDRTKSLLDQYEMLRPYLDMKTVDTKGGDSLLASSVLISNMNDVTKFSFEEFLYNSLYELSGYKSIDDEDYEEIRAMSIERDFRLIYQMIQMSGVNNDKKSIYLDYFDNLELIYSNYIELLEKVSEVYLDNYYMVEEEVNKHIESLRSYDDLLEELVYPMFNIDKSIFREAKVIDYYVSIIGFNGFSFVFADMKNKRGYLNEGILVFELNDFTMKNSGEIENISEKLIALGDSTRLKIISILNHSPNYLKELADKLELTPPTVSHHIQVLLNNQLISGKSEGRKVYYYINKDTMMSISKIFAQQGK
ncbi:MAG: winged helix-turn-helix transcriptional regulator [Tissierellia bacterium]|nr:winged helix-turn-helix transcriptional regulator [Tissierellia bacterium]